MCFPALYLRLAPSDEAPIAFLDFAAAKLKSGKVIASKPVATKPFSVLAGLILMYAHPRGLIAVFPSGGPKKVDVLSPYFLRRRPSFLR
jgi:hypothetical protein